MLVPIKWIDAQGAGCVDRLTVHTELYEAFSRGEDGLTGGYADHLKRLGRGPDRIAARIAELRTFQEGPPSNKPMPAVLTNKGRFQLLDGHHRAARLVYDGADFGRITIQSMSPLWQQMVDSLEAIYPKDPLKLYQEIEHPYFDEWDVSRSPARLQVVFKALADIGMDQPGDDSGYLEIGSCTGRFCREFARRGWRCFGLDVDRRVMAVAEYLDIVFGTSVNYVCTDDWDSVMRGGKGWGVICCLSVLHGYHTAGDHDGTGAKLKKLLDRCHVLITDGDVPGREYGGGVAWPQEQYQDWLQELAQPTHDVAHIGTTEGRAIYRCSRRI